MRILLTLLALTLLGCGAAEAPTPHRRVLVVGWDGASLRMVEPLLGAGRLPHLDALRQRGASAPLRSTAMPISSAAWSAAVTGYGPGETGVFGFHSPRESSYGVDLVSSRSLQKPPLWRLLTARGKTSVVWGVPLTYPPEPLRGTLVAGMLSPFDADYAWPAGKADALRARGFVPDLESWREDWSFEASDLERQLDLKEELLLEELETVDWDLAFVVFKSLDVVSHRSYDVDFAASVTPVYERLDAILGRLVEAVGPETDVLVVSDHGFTTYARGVNLHAWLIEHGYAQRRGEDDAGPAPEGTFDLRFAAERARRLDQLDLARTRAFASVCEGNVGSIRLNLAGREPQGVVAPEERNTLLAALARDLAAESWVARVQPTQALFPGPHQDTLPDLLVTAAPAWQVFADVDGSVAGVFDPVVPDHELLGLFVAAGPHVVSSRSREPLQLIDLAPTVLHLLGEPVFEDMHGQVWSGILQGLPPVSTVAPGDAGPLSPAAPFTPAELEELERRLGPLGYGG